MELSFEIQKPCYGRIPIIPSTTPPPTTTPPPPPPPPPPPMSARPSPYLWAKVRLDRNFGLQFVNLQRRHFLKHHSLVSMTAFVWDMLLSCFVFFAGDFGRGIKQHLWVGEKYFWRLWWLILNSSNDLFVLQRLRTDFNHIGNMFCSGVIKILLSIQLSIFQQHSDTRHCASYT